MYAVSDAYKLAVADSHRKSRIGAVLSYNGNNIALDDNDIIKDTVYVTNQCTNASEYEYGCVYSAECGITIKSNVDRHNLYDGTITLNWSLWTGTEWEVVPIGVFNISEANRINDKISIKAYDNMIKLDKPLEEDFQGIMPLIISYICEKCGVTMAQTVEELGFFVNAGFQYSVFAESVSTYRDLLAYVCMMCACFATFDRFGRLKLVQYATDPCKEISKKQRFTNASFSDYKTSYIGIKARFIAEENYAPYEATGEGTGIVIDLGDNPIVRGLPENKHHLLNNLLEVLKTVSYTPCEFETFGDPALELGDYVKNVNVGKSNSTYLSPITYYYWTYRGKHKIRAVGGNPRLASIKDKQSRQNESLESSIESKNIVVKSFTNINAMKVHVSEMEFAKLNFAATENSKILFLLTIRLNLSLDGVLVLQTYIDGLKDENRTYRKYFDKGDQVITISDIFNVSTNERHTVLISGKMEYFESDTRVQDARLGTLDNMIEVIKENGLTVTNNMVDLPTYNFAEVDTTVPTASIAKYGIKAILYGQGMSADSKWDGTINFAENIDKIIDFTGGLTFNKNVTEDLKIKKQTPVASVFNVTIGSVEFRSVFGFDGSIKENLRFGWSGAYTWYDVKDFWTWNEVKSKTWKDLRGADE